MNNDKLIQAMSEVIDRDGSDALLELVTQAIRAQQSASLSPEANDFFSRLAAAIEDAKSIVP